MNILGIGIDIVSLTRLHGARYKRRIAEYVLLPDELGVFEKSPDPVQYLGSRLAAKEAVIKACPEMLTYHDFSIIKNQGKPTVRFVGYYEQKYKVYLSLSHELDNAVGSAIMCETL